MSDSTPNNNPRRPLSEISHLFLSSLREQAQQGRPNRPQRIPPGAPRPAAPANDALRIAPTPSHSMDLTPEEFDGVSDSSDDQTLDIRRKRVTAVIGAHLNGHLSDRVAQYAAHAAMSGEKRIGVVQIDAAEFRVTLVEPGHPQISDTSASADENLDDRRMNESLLELNHDVDRWLLVLPDSRCAESRSLMRSVDDWLLLSTCDHDGIVAGYRTLKSFSDGPKAPLSIALLDAGNAEQADKVFAKLAGVCRQFLDWDVEPDAASLHVQSAQAVVHTVLWCRSTRDKAQLARAPQWRVLGDFLEIEPDAGAQAAHYGDDSETLETATTESSETPDVIIESNASEAPPALRAATIATEAPMQINREVPATTPIPQVAAPIPMPISSPMTITSEMGEVIELPDGASVLSAILSRGVELIATPINAPMCPGATVAISRDRGLVLVAQAGTGLVGLSAIASAVNWLETSRSLIAMALPQLNVDAHNSIRVHLLIDHADRDAEALRPLLTSDKVIVQTYRKLRWGQKTGLLLDAA